MKILDRHSSQPFALGFTISAITVLVHALGAAVLVAMMMSFGSSDPLLMGFTMLTLLGVCLQLCGLARSLAHRSCPTALAGLALVCLVGLAPTIVFLTSLFVVLPLASLFLGVALNVWVYVAPYDCDA